MPKTLPSATVDTTEEAAPLYQWALREYKVDARGEPVRDNDGQLIPINPLDFPLHNATVVVNGSRATISIPRAGKPHCVVDKLLQVAEPKAVAPRARRARKGDPDDKSFIITGISERMLKQGIAPEDAVVTFTVTGTNVTERKS